MFLKELRFNPDRYPVSDKYPFNMNLFRETDKITFQTPVTFFVGENGSGKSTLLKAIANACDIHIWGQAGEPRLVKNRYEKDLGKYINIDWERTAGAFFASEVFRHFALLLDEWSQSDPAQLKYFGGESLVTKSHGQCHMAFFKNRFKLKGLYLLDEPENALSPGRQIELADLIKEESSKGHAQFVICTHSPLLLAMPSTEILSFDSTPIKRTTFKETDHYRVYRDFFQNEERE